MGVDDTGKSCIKLTSATKCETKSIGAEGHASGIMLLVEDFSRAVRTGKPLPPEVATGEDGMMAVWIVGEANEQAVAEGDSFSKQ